MNRTTVGIACFLLTACKSEPRGGKSLADDQPARQRASTGWTIEETFKVHRVDQVRISPDSRRVLFAVRTAVLEGDKGEYHVRLYTANVDGTDDQPLTPAGYSATGAEWSPDGRWIAFAANQTGGSPGSGLWLIAASGGKPRAIDVGGTGVANPLWSPDGSRLAFTMPAMATSAQREAEQHSNAPRVVDAELRTSQLWVLRITDGAATDSPRVLSGGSVSVHTATDFGVPFDWSPDGSEIVFAYSREGDWSSDWRSTGVSIVNVSTGQSRPLVPSGGMAPRFSPDGNAIALLSSPSAIPGSNLYVHVVEVSAGKVVRLAATFDRQPTLVGWSADGRRIYVSEFRKSLTRLTALPVDGSAGVDLDAGDAVLEGFSLARSGTMVGFSRQTLTRPMEAHVSDVDRWAPVQVSRANASVPSYPLPRTELIQWRSHDGAVIEGLLTYPNAHAPNQRYPLVVAVRSGGVSFRQTFVASVMQGWYDDYYPITELALRGYAVLLCNARGGALPGYGPEYWVPLARPGEKAYHDVMSGVDHVITLGLADSARLGITGMSNGGLTTSWVITQTRRFKAAIVQSGITELISDATTRPWISQDLGAEPWEDIRPFLKHSPLLHLGGIATPTLILRGGTDDAVPWNQAFGMFRALQRRGVPTEMVVYPGEGHPVMAPKHLMDIGRRHVEWMGRYLR